MRSTLRSRIAILAAAAVFFLPVLASSPRGLTHLLTCRQKSQEPFTVVITPGVAPTLVTSLSETSGSSGGLPGTLCGGLALDIRAGTRGPETVAMRVILTNKTAHPWRGTVSMTVGNLPIALPMGRIGPGGVSDVSVDLHLVPGAHNLEGSLLLGP